MLCAAALLEGLHHSPRLACLPGGRDRQGRPLLVLAALEPTTSPSSTSNSSFSSQISSPPSPHSEAHNEQGTVVENMLKYLASTLSTETRHGGLVVLVDGQQASGRQVRASVRIVELALRSDVAVLLVLRPDAFWDKQRVDCTRSAHGEGQPLYIPMSRLHKYVDSTQLPLELGGSWPYDHARWIDNRIFVESFSRDAEGVVSDLEKVRHRLTALAPGVRSSSVEEALALSRDMFSATTDVTSKVLAAGTEVLQQYDGVYRATLPRAIKESELPQDLLDTKDKVSRTLEIVRGKQALIAQAWSTLERSCRASRELGCLEAGVARVTDWLLGVAERMLDSQQAVGRDLRTAEQLRQQHETLELQCRDTYGQYAELLHKIDTLPQSNIPVPSDLKCQRDFMDFVCRSFASRLERRRNVLITSLRFYRLVSEYFQRTSEVFEMLGMASDSENCESPETMLQTLEENQNSIEGIAQEARREGEKLMDVLSMPVKGALGREVEVSHEGDILHVQELLDAAEARRHVFCGAVQLHRLRLQQVAHVRAYEEDASQAVQWLQDLYQVMLKEHAYVGCSVSEIQTQKEAHQTFQDTAKGTYEYGVQLLGAARSLRQSCELSRESHEELTQRLQGAWSSLQTAATEQMTRLRVSAVFHRSVEKHCRQLQDLRDAVTSLGKVRRRTAETEEGRTRVRGLLASRESLLLEVGRMVRLGRLLRSRLREPLSPDLATGSEAPDTEHMNSAAVDAISERLAEVTALAEALDAALGAARHDPTLPSSVPPPVPASDPPCVTNAPSEAEVTCALTSTKEWYAQSGSSGDSGKDSPVPNGPESNNLDTAEQEDDQEDEEEFVTVSECTCTPPALSLSSGSYHTALSSENGWWRDDPAATRPASTTSTLEGDLDGESEITPPRKSPDFATEFKKELKAYRETIETMTTRLRVSHSEPQGLTSYMLSSESTRECIPVSPSPSPPNSSGADSVGGASADTLLDQMKESRDWVQLKVLETTPALTQLGISLDEATQLQRAHDEVLVQLQSKQNPVEELLRQADQLISTQNPRAEVYAAMAESLGFAWRDVNKLLDDRKNLLEFNVQYHSAAERSVERMIALEKASEETNLPNDAETAKKNLTRLHELKRSMLEAFMVALQEGRALLEKLQELENIGSLDSRPGHTRAEAQLAISQVQHWLEALHDRRRVLDTAWARRKAQLEQALAITLLAVELAALDATLKVRHEGLARSDQLGDSASSAELLLHEHNKLLPEAKDLQEKALQVTRAVDRVVSGEDHSDVPETPISEQRKAQLGMQAYTVLNSCSEYLHFIDQRSQLLHQTISFFRMAQAALTKLDQLEIQLATSEIPVASPQLAQLHAQVAKTLEEITQSPLEQGHALLATADACGTQGTEGVRRTVEEIENRKINLAGRCTAHQEESIRLTQALTLFLEQYNELYSWLVGVGESFIQGHQDMGSVLAMAQDFLDLHRQLLEDLQMKGYEVERLAESFPSLVGHLSSEQREDVETKMAALRGQWGQLRALLDSRLELSERYVRFHSLAVRLATQFDAADEAMRSMPSEGSESPSKQAPQEELWLACQQQLLQLNTAGNNFLQDTAKEVSLASSERQDPHLDLKRARLCVETLLEHFRTRQGSLRETWTVWQTRILTYRETSVQWQRIMIESSRTVDWVSRLDTQFYPLLEVDEKAPRAILRHLEERQSRVLPEAKRAQAEVELRLRAVEALQVQGEALTQRDNVISQLLKLNQRLNSLTSEYQVLLQMLIAFFKNVSELEKTIDGLQTQYRGTVLPSEASSVERMLKEHDASKHAVAELFRFTGIESEQVINRIRQQEPSPHAQKDEEVIREVLGKRQQVWERSWEERRAQLEQHLQRCQFDSDLHQLNQQLADLANQLGRVKGQYGESLATARANAQAFIAFERTIELLERRVTVFVSTAENLLAAEHMSSSHVQQELERLQSRWTMLRSQVTESKRLIDLSVQYFILVEEADEWFREGSRLLVTIARKSTTVKTPEEATKLLNEVEMFLRPGEARQNECIAKISSLASQLYGVERSKQVTTVLTENHEMIESFSVINIELTTLARNLKAAENERERQKREALEVDASLAAARVEAEAANAAAAAAEESRRATLAAADKLKEAERERLRKEQLEAEALLAAAKAEAEAARQAAAAAEEARKNSEAAARALNEAERERLRKEQLEAEASLAAARAEAEAARNAARAAEEARKAAEAAAQALKEAEARRAAEALENARREEEIRRAAELAAQTLREEQAKMEAAARALREEEERQAAARAREEQERRAAEARAREEEAERRLADIKAREEEAIRASERRTKEEEARRLAEQKAREEEEARRLQERKAREEEETRKLVERRAREEEEARRLAEKRAREEEARRAAESAAQAKREEEARIALEQQLKEEQQRLVREAKEKEEKAKKAIPPPKKIKHDEAEPTYIVPVFIEALRDAVIQEGEKFNFECRVSGYPTPDVEWFKDGISIQNNPDYHTSFNAGVCRLGIEETFSEDSAKFTCKAVNCAGKAETHAILTVREPGPQLTPPVVVKPLQDAIAKEGSLHRFECTVHGYPLPTVQWFKNSTCIDASPDYTITFNNGEAVLQLDEVFLEDEAKFCCQATNRLGSCQTEARLAVQPLAPTQTPAFTLPLTNIMARTGEKVKLDCEVTGIPEPRITWTRDGKPVKETREVKISSDKCKSTLTISEAFPKDAGVYTAKAKNLAGGATSSCNVSVKGRLPTETSDSEMASDMESIKPSIQMQLKDTTVDEGSAVKLDCIITGQPEPEVIWYHDGRPVKESKEVQLLFKGDRCTLVIKEALPEEAGEYRVVAVNSAGEAFSACQLTVEPMNIPTPEPQIVGVSPRFTKLLADILVPEGETTKFECAVEGDPVPRVSWLLNNHAILPSERISMSHDEDSGQVCLTIPNTMTTDRGVYTAKARNSVGNAKCFATLIVRSHHETPELQRKERMDESPHFTEILTDKNIIEGDSTKFECIVIGKPTPKVKWMFNDCPVSGRDFLVSTSGKRQVLSLPEVSQAHQGTIACVAENDAGKAVCQASLRVEVPDMMEINQLGSSEHTESFSVRRAVFMQSSSSMTSVHGGPRGVENHLLSSHSQQSMHQSGVQPPTHMQSHRVEEVHQVNQEKPVIHQQSSLVVSQQDKPIIHQQSSLVVGRSSPVPTPAPILKPKRKAQPPRFISPMNGKIVDQGADVFLEGIVDGYPTPTVTWLKNGMELPATCEVRYEHNKVSLQMKDVNVSDAGRYTCKAENEAGMASSTADVVVKKTIFPPVIGRRLQAQVVRIGERARLEVEVAGTPDPVIKWYKDGIPIEQVPGVTIKAMGYCHTLLIEQATPAHSGQYSVSATNSGGQAQSIADFAVIETAPHITLEVTKMVFEDVDEKNKGPTSLLSKAPFSPLQTFMQGTTSSIREESFSESSSKKEYSMRIERTSTPTSGVNDLHKETIIPVVKENGDVPKPQDMPDFMAKFKVEPPKEKFIPVQTEVNDEIFKKKSEVIMDVQQKHIPKEPEPNVDSTVIKSSQMHSSSVTTHMEKKYLSHNLNFDDIKLEPGPKPEICFSTLPEGMKLKEDFADRAKRFEDDMKLLECSEVPAGAVRILPVRQESLKQEQKPEEVAPLSQPQGFSYLQSIQQQNEEKPEVVQENFPTSSMSFLGKDFISTQAPVRPVTPGIRVPNPQGLTMEKLWTQGSPTPPMERMASPKLFKSLSEDRPASPRPSAEARAMEKLWTPVRPVTPVVELRTTPQPRLEPPWVERSASPRPNAEGLAMEKLWAAKHTDVRTTIIRKSPEPEVRRTIPPKRPLSVPPFGERPMSPKPSADGLAMDKMWAHKNDGIAKKKWPPSNVSESFPKPGVPWSKDGSIEPISYPAPTVQGDTSMTSVQSYQTSSQTSMTKEIKSETVSNTELPPVIKPPAPATFAPQVQATQQVQPPPQVPSYQPPPQVLSYQPPPQVPSYQPTQVPYQPTPQVSFQPIQPVPEPAKPKQHYIAEAEVVHKVNPVVEETKITSESKSEFQSSFSSTSMTESTMKEKRELREGSPNIIEERTLKPSEAKKLWSQRAAEPPPTPFKSKAPSPRKEFKIKQQTPPVDDSLALLGLVPGPPPEIGFIEASSVSTERRQSKVSESLEIELDKEPKRHLVGAVRTIPPSPKLTTPPRQVSTPPTTPKPTTPKPITPRSHTPVNMDKLFEPFPKLEPFPFKPDPEKPKSEKLPPPPKPSRFLRGDFGGSDYESDLESVRIPAKWRPYESDTEEPSYRKVKPPSTGNLMTRSRSTDPEPLPPSKFDNLPRFEGPPRPSVVDNVLVNKNDTNTQQQQFQQMSSSQQTTTRSSSQVTRITTSEQRSSSVTGSPTSNVKHGDIGKKSPPANKKLESPKQTVARGELMAESGYMADTDEPRRHQKKLVAGMESKPCPSSLLPVTTTQIEAQKHVKQDEKKQSHHQTHHHHHVSHKAHKKSLPSSTQATPVATSASSIHSKEPPSTLVVGVGNTKSQESQLEPFPYTPSPPSKPKARLPPPPSPSKFIKADIRESDYESDYDGRIPPLWRPHTSDNEDGPQYRPVQPPPTTPTPTHVLNSQSETPIPPTEFENPPPLSEGPLRPKFEPIEKITSQTFIDNTINTDIQKQVIKPMALFASPVDGVLQGSPPKNSYNNTSPHQGSFAQYQNGNNVNGSEIPYKQGSPPKMEYAAKPNQYPKATQMETSKKVHMSESTEYSRRFVTMEQTTRVIQYGEKEQHIETPLEPFPFEPDPEIPKSTVRVPPPPTPTKFIRGEFRESDYESDAEGIKIKPKWTPYDSDTDEPHYRKVQPPAIPAKTITRKDREVTPPTVFDNLPASELEQQRLQRLEQMRRRFSEENLKPAQQQVPVLPVKAAEVASQHMSKMTQAFKSKAQQFVSDITQQQAAKPETPALDGTDPSAYREESRHSEFGSKHIDPETGLIYFKYDFGYEFGLVLPGEGKPKKVEEKKDDDGAIEFPIIHETTKQPQQPQRQAKRVKWESESELSEADSTLPRASRSVIPPIQRWEPSPSPVSSPCPSPWGRHGEPGSRGKGQGRGNTPTPPSTPSTPGSSHGAFPVGQLRKPPMFITPLRDIAAISGNSARFECIAQAEPSPNIMWSKDGRIIENSSDRQMYYRNGVCRLTIPQAFPEDAGSYTCTATNAVGSSSCSASLQVPGERRGRRPL